MCDPEDLRHYDKDVLSSHWLSSSGEELRLSVYICI